MQALRNLSSIERRTVKLQVFQRDGWQCVWCGASEDLTMHHIVPVRRGGDWVKENLVTFCRCCHNAIEALERQRDQQFIDEMMQIEATAFVEQYTAAQQSIGQTVSNRDRRIIKRLLMGRA